MIESRFAVASPSRRIGASSTTARSAALASSAPAIPGRQRLSRLLEASILAQLMLAMGFLAVALILYLAQASQQSVLEFSIVDLQQRQLQLNMQNANLHAQATALQSYGRIDSVATGQLRMIKPDAASTIWISPVIPRVPNAPPPATSAAAAEKASQPLAWVSSFISFVQSSL